MKEKPHWPGWFYGPNGAAAIFQCREDVPAGWEDHPSKVKRVVDEDYLRAHPNEVYEVTPIARAEKSEQPKPKRPYRRKAK